MRVYIYQPIPGELGKAGIYKCQGFASSQAEATTPEMRKAYPDAVIVENYRGDRACANTLRTSGAEWLRQVSEA